MTIFRIASAFRGKMYRQHNDKLVFVGLCPKLPVIASQCAHWRVNPPVEWNQVTIITKKRGGFHSFRYYSVHFPSNRGIATTSVRTGLAMTGNFDTQRQTPICRTVEGAKLSVLIYCHPLFRLSTVLCHILYFHMAVSLPHFSAINDGF